MVLFYKPCAQLQKILSIHLIRGVCKIKFEKKQLGNNRNGFSSQIRVNRASNLPTDVTRDEDAQARISLNSVPYDGDFRAGI